MEFIIVEDWVQNDKPTLSGYQNKGKYVVDGDSYELFVTTNSGPNIFGTNAFYQYYSLRNSGRQKGHVDISAHFRKWEKKGLPNGNIESVTVLAEVFSGSTNTSTGSVDFTYVNIYPQANYVSWLADNELSGADAAWDATPEKWGGKVTNAYMYNKGKDNPFRFPAGFAPYMNLREQELLQSIRPVMK